MFLQPAGKKARALETVEQQGCEGALLGGGGREAPNGADVVEGVRVWGIPPDAFSPPPLLAWCEDFRGPTWKLAFFPM